MIYYWSVIIMDRNVNKSDNKKMTISLNTGEPTMAANDTARKENRSSNTKKSSKTAMANKIHREISEKYSKSIKNCGEIIDINKRTHIFDNGDTFFIVYKDLIEICGHTCVDRADFIKITKNLKIQLNRTLEELIDLLKVTSMPYVIVPITAPKERKQLYSLQLMGISGHQSEQIAAFVCIKDDQRGWVIKSVGFNTLSCTNKGVQKNAVTNTFNKLKSSSDNSIVIAVKTMLKTKYSVADSDITLANNEDKIKIACKTNTGYVIYTYKKFTALNENNIPSVYGLESIGYKDK